MISNSLVMICRVYVYDQLCCVTLVLLIPACVWGGPLESVWFCRFFSGLYTAESPAAETPSCAGLNIFGLQVQKFPS